MGVPALFRWLSKKYPKIIYPVVEDEEVKIEGPDGDVLLPLDITKPNPNGMEYDNLYLDMNGIVHPCTHPEGKPAPETEEEMMTEIFAYTERVFSMARPRKLLFMAIDGVAPRAKMNQQRSRRFRASQEARDKETARQESFALWEAMGKEVSEEERGKKSWDTNAITPGTPFMSLLAASLRYWVVQKMNTDPGWKNIQVIISDASVPGEGEHKIMDFIRRQRSNPGHDPNTQHVIYGLDADLIMLALATHEPHFRVLREDVFNEGSSSACRRCGQDGHYAAQCTAAPGDIKKPSSDKKPFIFLDVTILREYLEIELNVIQAPFPFNFEQAIDDWVLLIFFVGNDFLPHLPSLEIREGAIDTLLKIWKQELPRMAGYLTNHGDLVLPRAQIILEGLAKREDEIFRRRREGEERQDQNAKRRKIEQEAHKFANGPSSTLGLTVNPTPPSSHGSVNPVHPSLPRRPDFAANADSIGLGAAPTAESMQNMPLAAQALAGSNHDVVANRRAIRMANMSAAEVLKAELSGTVAVPMKSPVIPEPQPVPTVSMVATSSDVMDEDIPGFGSMISRSSSMAVESNGTAGVKRSFEEGPGDGTDASGDAIASEDETPAEADADASSLAFKVNGDGTVEQADQVKLWEPGYKERYYRQKFGVEFNDTEFRKRITKCYLEGMAWVLQYYYQGTPSWTWYYPYHFAPFAADFEDLDKLSITFEVGQPFKPFEQLMGVFPADSRKHIPEPFHHLMTDAESPIIDFYPYTFQIDMNGKRMAWQGVALLPFIDEKRLLDAMSVDYPKLNEDELRRNSWGNNVIFASDEHPVYPFYEQLYGKRKNEDVVPIPINLTGGISGGVLPNPDCLPGSTYYCPLTTQGLPDIRNDRSLSVLYFFPKQLTPHRSILLPGLRHPPRQLTSHDLEMARNGGRGRGRGSYDRGGGGRGSNYNDRSRGNDPFHVRPHSYSGGDRYSNGRGGGPPPRSSYQPPQSQQSYRGYDNGRSYDNSKSYQPQSYSGYGGYGSASNYPPPPPAPPYGGYGGGGYGSNSYGGYGRGGGGGDDRGGYGGYGGSNRGSYPHQDSYGRYNSRPDQYRSRGRGWQ